MLYRLLLCYFSIILIGCAAQQPISNAGDWCKVAVQYCKNEDCSIKEQLDISLEIKDEQNEGYSRELFIGKNSLLGWQDADSNCKNTRAEILEKQSLEPVVYSSDGCGVVKGLWFDPYSDEMYETAKDLDIDHLVPLKEAYESGAYMWDSERRVKYANDTEITKNLLPVWNSLNRSKGHKEPHEWLPPNNKFYCDYYNRWTFTKWYWGLSVDRLECTNLLNVLPCRY